MSAYQRELLKVLKLAKNIQDESTFQRHTIYKKFKCRQIEKEIPTLLTVLSERKFYNESIFWSLKILHFLKIQDVGQRIRTIGHVSISYFALNDYKNCLEYGEKYIKHFDTLYKTDIKKINR